MITLVTGVITTVILSLVTICFVKILFKKLQFKHEEVEGKEEWTDQDLSKIGSYDKMNEPDIDIVEFENVSDVEALSSEIYVDIKDIFERNSDDLSPNIENIDAISDGKHTKEEDNNVAHKPDDFL